MASSPTVKRARPLFYVALLRLIRRAHELAPFRDFGLDERAEFLRAARDDFRAERGLLTPNFPSVSILPHPAILERARLAALHRRHGGIR